jgi:hypothetical protein
MVGVMERGVAIFGGIVMRAIVGGVHVFCGAERGNGLRLLDIGRRGCFRLDRNTTITPKLYLL